MRVLFLADTHLGFDDPLRPRVERRRRGPDFYRSFELAIEPALAGEVDVVIHGGDIFFRSKVRPDVVERTLDIIASVTGAGIPFVLVPGNHERSATPMPLLWSLPGLHVFDRPRSFVIDTPDGRLLLAGFPCERNGVRDTFTDLVADTGYRDREAEARLLCLHQSVEGAVVGPVGYTFRSGADVVPGRLLPGDVAGILSGHIHRRQTLTRDLRNVPLPAPVIYPGSTERTAFAEKDETKGFIRLSLESAPDGRGRIVDECFIPLLARSMIDLELAADDPHFEKRLPASLGSIDPDAILRLTLTGKPTPAARRLLAAASLRELAPRMNIELRWKGIERRAHRR